MAERVHIDIPTSFEPDPALRSDIRELIARLKDIQATSPGGSKNPLPPAPTPPAPTPPASAPPTPTEPAPSGAGAAKAAVASGAVALGTLAAIGLLIRRLSESK